MSPVFFLLLMSFNQLGLIPSHLKTTGATRLLAVT